LLRKPYRKSRVGIGLFYFEIEGGFRISDVIL
jgi:hypothetical protein